MNIFYLSEIVTLEMNTIQLLHVGEGNMKIYSPKSIIFLEGNARWDCDTRGWIHFHISWTRMLWMFYYTEWNQENTAGKHILCPLERCLRHLKNTSTTSDAFRVPLTVSCERTITLAGKSARFQRGWNMIFISRNIIFVLRDHVFWFLHIVQSN